MVVQTFIAIDPSINSLGFSILNTDGIVLTMGLVRTTTYPKDYMSKAHRITCALYNVLLREPLSAAILERPERWTSHKGVASQDSSALLKLTYVVGSLQQMLTSMDYSVWTVSAKHWKGQTPKRIMVQRAYSLLQSQERKFTTNHAITDHEAESVLLGRYCYEHLQYPRNGVARFSPPVEEVKKSSGPFEMDYSMGAVSKVQDISGCKVLCRYRRRPS